MKNTIGVLIFLLGFSVISFSQNIIDLSGKWTVLLDQDKAGKIISLPGSLAEAGYGQKTTGSDFGILTPTYKYIGKAWYQREINIPKSWKNKSIEIFLERVLWESRVFIDGKEVSVQDALGTPHLHMIGKLNPGKHLLTIRVDNDMIHNIGDKGHAYGDYTQSIWNGIVGKMEIKAKDPVHFTAVRTFSDIENDQLKVALKIQSESTSKAKINIEIINVKTGEKKIVKSVKQKIIKGVNSKEILIDLNGALKKWNEFDPTVYTLKASISSGKSNDQIETEFGFLKISHDKHNVLINDHPVFLRGNLDCIHFPLTGYPSTKIEDWIRIFKIYKSYGLNHVRYHSWCPPEAAFKAANRVGIYMQAEASIWIDWWMSEPQERPEMDTKGYPKGLGKDPERDQFVIAEMNRVVDFYGNNPSFTMFCIGNELGNSDFDVMSKWVGNLKKKDPRRLYAISTARKITSVDDYSATHYIKDIGRTRGLNGARTDWDFEKVYSQMDIPIIAHEIGQWPVYPSWKEIDKYKGVLKARNFEEFRETARKNGIEDQDEDFRKASGALNQNMYKYEIESFLRTESCAGIQLLSMQDYQGQGEALIGWLDAFWDSKGITSPVKFIEHFDETVPLLRMEKFVWENDEVFTAKAQISHYGQTALKNGKILMQITSEDGKILKSENRDFETMPIGSLKDVGNISMNLKNIKKAQRLTISLKVTGTRFKNEWNIWVFPKELPAKKDKDLIITNEINDETLFALNNGKKVLLLANNLGTEENSVNVDYYPLYWSLTFFPGQGKTSIGMLLKDKHPAFNDFPTSFHSDWQWEKFGRNTKAFILNDLPKTYKPIAQIVDDFHRNNKEGAIFEFKVGKGKLLVCGYDINNKDNPVARQLKFSLLNYMDSTEFKPGQVVNEAYLKDLFPMIPDAQNISASEGFQNVLLQVDAGTNLIDLNKSKKWGPMADKVTKTTKGVKYKVHAEGVWKDKNVTAWHGRNMTIEMECPQGILGTFYVQFNDWNKQNRKGVLEFEGRKVKLGNHQEQEGKWIKFHVMREDSNDGKLILKTKVTQGGNLMISQIVLTKE